MYVGVNVDICDDLGVNVDVGVDAYGDVVVNVGVCMLMRM